MLIEQGTNIIVKQMQVLTCNSKANNGIRGFLCERKTVSHYLGRILTFKVSKFRKKNGLTASSSFLTNH